MTIRFRNEKDRDYRLIPVNGALGVVTPTGDIRVDLYYESPTMPDSEAHEVSEDGTLGPLVSHDRVSQLQRTLFVGMVISPTHAGILWQLASGESN